MFANNIKYSLLKISLVALLFALGSAALASGWEYKIDNDPSTEKYFRSAELRSSSSINLPFPYNGINYARIVIAQKSDNTIQAFLLVDKGQILCLRQECSAQFHAGEVRDELTFIRDRTLRTNIVKIKYPGWLIKQLSTSREIMVTLDFYNAGSHVLRFTSPQLLRFPKSDEIKAPKLTPSDRDAISAEEACTLSANAYEVFLWAQDNLYSMKTIQSAITISDAIHDVIKTDMMINEAAKADRSNKNEEKEKMYIKVERQKHYDKCMSEFSFLEGRKRNLYYD